MDTTERNKVLLLGGVGMTVVILLLLLVVSRFSDLPGATTIQDDTLVNQVDGTQPVQAVNEDESDTVSEVSEPFLAQPNSQPTLDEAPEQSWQDKVVQYDQAPGNTEVNAPATESQGSGSPYSIADLPNLDLNINDNSTGYVPPPPKPIVVNPPASNNDDDATIATLKSVSFRTCGSVSIPTGFGLALFALSAKNDPAIECLGKAIASQSCGDVSASIESDGEALGTVYVTARPDDSVCSVGVPASGGEVSLCSVEQLMNIGLKENKTMAQWQVYFADDPGRAFTDLYVKNSDALQDPNQARAYDCKTYEL